MGWYFLSGIWWGCDVARILACRQLESLLPSYLRKVQAIYVSAVLLLFSKIKAVFPFPYLRFSCLFLVQRCV